MDQDRIVLKTTPPRAHRMVIARPRLAQLWDEVRERAFIEVCAPGGFGKSTVLVQWRLLWLERGALVTWATLDAQDGPIRFARVLAQAMRSASGRASFDRIALEYGDDPERALDALTAVLSEIASLAAPTVIVLDDGENLPRETARDALAYLLMNAPANLTVVLGTRVPLVLPTVELTARGECARVTVDDLRLDLDDAVALLRKRFGKRLELDDCVRLHEMTEGWPIGLQLAAAAIERSPHYHTAVLALSARSGDLERYFIESLLDHLPEAVAAFLTRIAILDPLSRELCEATTGSPMAAPWLEQMMADTPIFTVTEAQGWMRLHALARDFLLGRFEQLPEAERTQLHLRAAQWLAQRRFFPDAARHALAAKDEPLAQACASQGLWSVATSGDLAEALQWIPHLAPETLADNVQLRLIGAWVMALGNRPDEARRTADEVLRDPSTEPAMTFMAALVASCAEACADRIGLIPAIMARWPTLPDYVVDPVHRQSYFNTCAVVAVASGELAQVHAMDTSPAPEAADNRTLALVFSISRLYLAVALLREGDPIRVEELLQGPLAHAERTQGRRSTVACLHAVGMAAALLERDEVARAEALLAHRVDVMERFVFPDAILLAYETRVRLAAAQGDERRALGVLGSMEADGRARSMPRLVLAGLAMRIHLHACKGHVESATALMPTLEALAPTFEGPEYLPFLREYKLRCALARALLAIARFDGASAQAELSDAAELARAANFAREAVTVQALRAVAAELAGSERALPLLAEALSIGAMRGCLRLVEEAHPAVLALRRRLEAADARQAPAAASTALPPAHTPPRKPAASPGGLLTPKEAEVLRLVAAGHSNKHIAKAMDVGDETVKWHLKNLFAKLSAGSRRHAVDRARMMGLVIDEDAVA
ncbi:LuxR C-terminal-related transcriptional regulator [Variovorax sp. dw_308]|uniref:LuxR C-terminal-related transcriptional regulator n=1 Tax=Variovorax sp. dw_308 TaxID=2721546 RepID=UPI001C455F91|nr:LuxR C-terminal-related transcriptional regulator [Variovorax sp. dw_308]